MASLRSSAHSKSKSRSKTVKIARVKQADSFIASDSHVDGKGPKIKVLERSLQIKSPKSVMIKEKYFRMA
jgi:hypothetical protein